VTQEARDEQFERALIVGKVTVTNLNENLLVDELNLFIAQAMLAHAFVDVLLRGGKGRGSVIVIGPCAA
jgi:hypothetical protein